MPKYLEKRVQKTINRRYANRSAEWKNHYKYGTINKIENRKHGKAVMANRRRHLRKKK
jgi:hypothetical protein